MASRGSLFSQTLLEITNTKLEELAKGRAAFEVHRQKIHALAQSNDDPIQKLTAMADAIKTCFSVSVSDGSVVRGSTRNPRLEIDLRNLDRLLTQAKYDPSVSQKTIDQGIQMLLRHLDVQSHKFEYASLYANLTTEWLSAKQEPNPTVAGEDVPGHDFEHIVSSKRLGGRAAWEQSVFEASAIDQTALNKMLRGLFEATPDDSKHILKALKTLRESVAEFERSLVLPGALFTALYWVIDGLLVSDLLSDEKKEVLRDFKNNSVILREIADVLEMRLAALQNWSWGEEVLLDERRQVNGTYKIYMHEDLLQAILLQYIGIKWSVFWKGALTNFRKSKDVWKSSGKSLSSVEKKRRDYYLGPTKNGPSLVSTREKLYRRHYFLLRLRDDVGQQIFTEEGEEEADIKSRAASNAIPMQMQTAAFGARGRTPQAPQQAMVMQQRQQQMMHRSMGGKANRVIMKEADIDEEEEDSEDDNNSDGGEPESPMAVKQRLLHLLSTDILIKTRLQGGLTCFRSQIENFYSSLSHDTIECILTYLGVSKKWTSFFKRFLQAPLKFADDPTAQARQRKTGTPGSHVLSDVFGEVILFCLDFQINQTTNGEILWRMQDDFWFWSSDHAVCVKAWSTIEEFMRLAGLKLNRALSGSARIVRKASRPHGLASADVGDVIPKGEIRWGMLRLDPDSGRFEIDQDMVDEHIDELSRQLKDKRRSIFAWIQAWNTYAATFFTSNFGKPANCFGRPHVDNMLATHERIQRRVFSASTNMDDSDLEMEAGTTSPTNGSVIEYLKQTISHRFGIHDIPDGYFFFPTELGGLEVRSPFIRLLQIRDGVRGEDPSKLLDDFEEAEKEAYRVAKQRYESGKTHTGRQHKIDLSFTPADRGTFLPWEEFIRYREEIHYDYTNELAEVYTTLLEQPQEQGIEMPQNGEISAALLALGKEGTRGILPSWHVMEPYWKWVTQLYGPEMIDRFGSLKIVDSGLLPMGMVSLFRSGRVKWQD